MKKVYAYRTFVVLGSVASEQFCVRGYHVERITGLHLPADSKRKKEPVWQVTGPCSGSCKEYLVEIPDDVLTKIRKEKALRKRIK